MMEPFNPLGPIHELEQFERLRRAAEPFAGLIQQVNCIEPFYRIQQQVHAATARSIEQFELQERLTRSVQPALTAAATAHSTYLESLIQSQQTLAQIVAREVIDASRVAFEAATIQSAFAEAMNGFTERILNEAVVRDTLARHFATRHASIASSSMAVLAPNYDEVVTLLFNGLAEAGAADAGLSSETFLWKIHGWLELLPPNVKQIVIQFIAGLMLLILTEAVDWCKTSAHEHVAALPKSGPPAQSAPQEWPDNDMCH